MLNSKVPDILSRLQQLSSIKEVEKTQCIITKAGLFNHIFVISKIISFLALSPLGSLVYAQAIFEDTAMENPFVCNTMIRAYSKSVFPMKAICLYNFMHRMGIKSDNFTFPFVLKACARVLWCNEEDMKCSKLDMACKGAEIHSQLFKLGLDQDCFIQNSLVYLYSRCGKMNLAHHVFDEMTDKTITSWNVMISAYDQINDSDSADSLIASMPGKNLVTWNMLIARYVRLGKIEDAQELFQEMTERDAVSWNSMIAGYVQIKDYARALALFHEMEIDNVKATDITLISVLGACAEMGAIEIGRKIHLSLKRRECKIEGYLSNALVDMYAKCGHLNLAWEVFSEIEMRHVSCWNAMIIGLAVHGYCEEALRLFSTMEMSVDGARPNRVTFLGVLIACSHNGLVDESRKFFNCMVNEYRILPDIKHYGCMVDLLSRCGLLKEAHQMIKTMPFEATSVLWRTLLGACSVHHDVDLAEESFQQLFKMESLRDGDYVLLSNIYAAAQRWNDVERVRSDMFGSGVLKKPGSSHIEMK